MFANQLKGLLILGGSRVLQPEQTVGLEVAGQPRRLNGRQTMMHVMQQLDLRSVIGAKPLEQLGHRLQILGSRPLGLGGQDALRRLVCIAGARHTVRLLQSRHAALRTDRLVSHLNEAPHLRAGLIEIAPVSMSVDERTVARAAAEQLVQRQAGKLGKNIPKRDIHRGNGCHRHWATAPIGAAIEELPRVLDPPGVASDEVGNHVLLQICRHRQLTPIERRVPDAENSGARFDLQGHEISPRARHDHACRHDGAVATRPLCIELNTNLGHRTCSST